MNTDDTAIRLRPLQNTDEAELAPLFSDRGTLRFYLPTLLRSYSSEQLRHLLADWNDQPGVMILSIVGKLSDREEVLGLVNLNGISYTNGNCELGIALLSHARGQGAAKAALIQSINYCFDELRLHRVWCRVMADNQPSLKLFHNLGFTDEGRLRQHVNREGRYLDLIVLGLLRDEWYRPEG